MNTKPRLIEMNLDDAMQVKWQMGRDQYGPVFNGQPVEELAAEIVDGLNYCKEAEAWGYDMLNVASNLRIMWYRVQRIYKTQKGRRPA